MPSEVSLSKLQEDADSSPNHPPNYQPAEKDGEISLLDVLIVLAERKRTIFVTTACVAVLAVVLSLVLPKRFTAIVTLLPPQQNSSIGGALASQLGNLSGVAALAGGGLGLKNPNELFVGMLKSRTVEDAMVKRYGLMQEYHARYATDARIAFEHHASVDGNGKDGLIHISVEGRDPNRAAELANGYVDQFRTLSEHLAITEASQRRLFFERQLEGAKDNLANSEEALKQTEQQTGLIQLDSQARALIESAASLRAQIAAKEVQIQSLQTFATDQNAQIVQAQQELDSLRAQFAKLGGSGAGSETNLIVPRGRVPQAGLEYIRKLRDVKYHETIFEILARQYEVAKLDEAKQGSLIQVVDAAVPPDRRSFPKRGPIVIGATIVGFIVSLFYALFRAGYEQMKRNPETDKKLDAFRKALAFRGRPA